MLWEADGPDGPSLRIVDLLHPTMRVMLEGLGERAHGAWTCLTVAWSRGEEVKADVGGR